jgi:hypothetical protein
MNEPSAPVPATSAPTPQPSLPPRLQDTLAALESTLASKHSRAQLDQRPIILQRDAIVRTLLLHGETDAHIARVLNLSRERVRQIHLTMPAFVRRRHKQIQKSIKMQKARFLDARKRSWKRLLRKMPTTVAGERRPEYTAFVNMLRRCYPPQPATPSTRHRGRSASASCRTEASWTCAYASGVPEPQRSSRQSTR